MNITTIEYAAPCGRILLGSARGRLCVCDWLSGKPADRILARVAALLGARIVEAPSELCAEAARQLDEYFGGERRSFSVPLLAAGSDFRQTVWQTLEEIPYGSVVSYGSLARRIGRPEAVRAVANAVGANPLSVFIPCHRVIGSGGSLTGYGGGVEVKRALLELEQSCGSDLFR